MTTQEEVVNAFANFETSPRRASNFKMVTVGNGGLRAFLVGGDHAVYAERRPINQITVYPDWTHVRYYNDSSITGYGIRNQCRIVSERIDRQSRRSVVPQHINVTRDGREGIGEDRVRPTVDDFEELA